MDWLVWYFWTSRRCKHVAGKWQMRELGMGKIRYCDKCGRCLDLI